MKFTRIQRTRVIEMLRTARRLIKNRNHEYICVALEQAARDRNKMDAIIYRLPGWTFDEVVSFNERNKK